MGNQHSRTAPVYYDVANLMFFHRSLFGNVASLVMSGNDSCSSSSVKSETPDVTIMGVESIEGEILELSSPVSYIFCDDIYIYITES